MPFVLVGFVRRNKILRQIEGIRPWIAYPELRLTTYSKTLMTKEFKPQKAKTDTD
jgi:hypothetical protein